MWHKVRYLLPHLIRDLCASFDANMYHSVYWKFMHSDWLQFLTPVWFLCHKINHQPSRQSACVVYVFSYRVFLKMGVTWSLFLCFLGRIRQEVRCDPCDLHSQWGLQERQVWEVWVRKVWSLKYNWFINIDFEKIYLITQWKEQNLNVSWLHSGSNESGEVEINERRLRLGLYSCSYSLDETDSREFINP